MNENRTFKVIEDLADYLVSAINKTQNFIITIDGRDGSGKTYVSKILSDSIKIKHVELDNFIIKKMDRFVDFIDYETLIAKIDKELMNHNSLIIDGVCVLSVLEKIKIKPDITIYVKRTNQHGIWYDEDYFDLNSSPEEIFKKDEEGLKQLSIIMGTEYSPSKKALFHEIVLYHFVFKPHINSDIYFENVIQE